MNIVTRSSEKKVMFLCEEMRVPSKVANSLILWIFALLLLALSGCAEKHKKCWNCGAPPLYIRQVICDEGTDSQLAEGERIRRSLGFTCYEVNDGSNTITEPPTYDSKFESSSDLLLNKSYSLRE